MRSVLALCALALVVTSCDQPASTVASELLEPVAPVTETHEILRQGPINQRLGVPVMELRRLAPVKSVMVQPPGSCVGDVCTRKLAELTPDPLEYYVTPCYTDDGCATVRMRRVRYGNVAALANEEGEIVMTAACFETVSNRPDGSQFVDTTCDDFVGADFYSHTAAGARVRIGSSASNPKDAVDGTRKGSTFEGDPTRRVWPSTGVEEVHSGHPDPVVTGVTNGGYDACWHECVLIDPTTLPLE